MSPKSGTGKYEQLLLKCRSLEAIPTAVAYPCEEMALAGAIEAGGYGERLLCAMFAFEDQSKRPLDWIYNYKRGAFYPFVPASGDEQRDTEREFVLKAQVGSELPLEQELERWFPLWGIPI